MDIPLIKCFINLKDRSFSEKFIIKARENKYIQILTV